MALFRIVGWVVLLCGGALALILTILFTPPGVAVATGIIAVGCLIAFGVWMAWHHGIRRHVTQHLGRRWDLGEVLRHRVRTVDRVNLQVALDWLQSQSNTPGPFGIPNIAGVEEDEAAYSRTPADLVGLLYANTEPQALVWEPMPTSTDDVLHCASNALYLLRVLGEPVVILVQGRSFETSKRAHLQVLARTQQVGRAALNEVLRLSHEQSVYRGQVISLERVKSKTTDLGVKFHDLGRVDRDAIVLPGDVVQILDRNLLSFFRHADALRRAGQQTRHGVLLHGPPGTGKTLVTRWVAANVGATVLLITGREYAQLRATCALARLLAPSLVILEDVDLIAADRRRNAHTPLLHELLDEMDGLAATADIVFLLTTNRPEALEAALAARPGRVDQAVYFPLPDLDCRRRLAARFAAGLNVSAVNLEPLLQRTEGASPAFLKELFRRAALLAIERGEAAQPLALRDDDFERGLRELLHAGGPLTRTFLGFPAAGERGA